MRCETGWLHYWVFSGKTSPFVTSTHNFSVLLFEKKNCWKVIWIKLSGMENQKGLDRAKSIAFLAGSERYMMYTCCSTDSNSLTLYVRLLCDFRRTQKFKIYGSPQAPSTKRMLFFYREGILKGVNVLKRKFCRLWVFSFTGKQPFPKVADERVQTGTVSQIQQSRSFPHTVWFWNISELLQMC